MRISLEKTNTPDRTAGGLLRLFDCNFLPRVDEIRVCNPIYLRELLPGGPVARRDAREGIAELDGVNHSSGGRCVADVAQAANVPIVAPAE